MIRIISHIRVACLAHIIHHRLYVVLTCGSKFIHAVEESNQGSTKVCSNQRPAKDPGKEITGGQVVEECLATVRGLRGRDMELYLPRPAGLATTNS